MTSSRKQPPKPAFEESLRRLDDIVQRLEQGDVPLEESLKMYEEGVQLSRLCLQQLQDAELRLKKLTRDAAGQLVLSDMDDDELPERPTRGKDAP